MRRRNDPFEKPWVIYAAVIGVIAVIVIALVFFLGGSSGEPPAAPASSPSGQTSVVGVAPSVIMTQVPVTIPTQGVFVHVSYIGGFTGEYGMDGNMTTMSNSGDRYFEVENATGTVSATFSKEDSSTGHELLVAIFRDGQSLQEARNTSPYGEASVSITL